MSEKPTVRAAESFTLSEAYEGRGHLQLPSAGGAVIIDGDTREIGIARRSGQTKRGFMSASYPAIAVIALPSSKESLYGEVDTQGHEHYVAVVENPLKTDASGSKYALLPCEASDWGLQGYDSRPPMPLSGFGATAEAHQVPGTNYQLEGKEVKGKLVLEVAPREGATPTKDDPRPSILVRPEGAKRIRKHRDLQSATKSAERRHGAERGAKVLAAASLAVSSVFGVTHQDEIRDPLQDARDVVLSATGFTATDQQPSYGMERRPSAAEQGVADALQALDDHDLPRLQELASEGANYTDNKRVNPEAYKQFRDAMQKASTPDEAFTVANQYFFQYGVTMRSLAETKDVETAHGSFTAHAFNKDTQNQAQLNTAVTRIADTLAQHPIAMTSSAELRSFVLSSTFAPHDPKKRIAGVYDPEHKTIELPIDWIATAPPEAVDHTIEHELGHANERDLLAFHALRSAALGDTAGDNTSPAVSEYAQTDPAERSAETFAAALSPQHFLPHPDQAGEFDSEATRDILRVFTALENRYPGYVAQQLLTTFPDAKPQTN